MKKKQATIIYALNAIRRKSDGICRFDTPGDCGLRRTKRSGVLQNGTRFGKAVKYEISPNYEDVSDYQDINETDPEEEIRSADITLE